MHKATQLTLEMPATSRLRLFNHGRFAKLIRPYSGGLYGIDMYGAGDRQAYETNYIFNSIRPESRASGFGAMLAETNNHGGPGHQFASTFWRLLGNGAKGMMYFTPGFVGAPKGSDWDKFSMIDRATGRPKDRWFYAARWAAAVHRSERFWSEAVPASDAPRVAMLMPRRDILLSERSERNPGEGRYAYARNHRWMVYRWLREQGYWVDVLPYEKLTDGYLVDYSALLLVGAEHLTSTECETVARYVAAGGILVADTMPGYFDQHHRVLNAIASPAGLVVHRHADLRPVAFDFGGRTVEGVTAYTVNAETARVLARNADGEPLALLQAFREGRILSLPFELGSLVLKGKDTAVVSLQSEQEPTAGAEQYAAYVDEFLIGEWLAGLLAQAGLRPAYAAIYPSASDARIVRVEQPYVDAAGNVAVVIGNRAQLHPQEILPAGAVELPLPGGTWTHAFWAAAETDDLVQIEVTSLGEGRHRVELPSIASAGIVYLFNDHTPLLGIVSRSKDTEFAASETARVKPGVAFALPVQLVNPNDDPLPAGSLTVQVPAGWSVT
ncbi:MAG TPA: alpha-galactosidase, partial [Opitutus sp.]|nr:alpha-galactosidase [Opitutus sp.]